MYQMLDLNGQCFGMSCHIALHNLIFVSCHADVKLDTS